MELQSAPASLKNPPAAMTATPRIAPYRPHGNGRFRITSTALINVGMEHPDRVLDTDLWGRPAKVLLLEQPLKLGDKHSTAGGVEFDLRPIRLHELPGWPPRMASVANVKSIPALMDCAVRSANYLKGMGPGQESLELVLEHSRKTFRAWHVGCPVELLRCVEATLNQEECVGKKLADLQDIRLIGPPGE